MNDQIVKKRKDLGITIKDLSDALGYDLDCLLYTSPSPRD